MEEYYGTKRISATPKLKSFKEGPPKEGYEVVYPDGYTSWSPKDVFEAAYQPLTAMSFGHALAAMRDGHSVSRQGWNGKGQSITLQMPTELSKMTLPYLYIRTVQGDLVPWLASQTDLLANDWMIAEENLGC